MLPFVVVENNHGLKNIGPSLPQKTTFLGYPGMYDVVLYYCDYYIQHMDGNTQRAEELSLK